MAQGFAVLLPEDKDEWSELKQGKPLDRRLDRIEQIERSSIRMLETARRRLRSKLKRFQVSHSSSGSDAIDVRMYDTHNPGFCYHCNGAMRKTSCETSPRKKFIDVFDVVNSMIFTNGEVDPDKIICLHILAVHYAKSGCNESSEIRPVTPLVEKGRKENFHGTWNSILPCYVLEIQRNVDDVKNFSDELKRHKDPLIVEAEEEIVEDFLRKYEKFVEENSDVGLAMSTDRKRAKMVPNGIGNTTIIPPHVYSLLGAAQELKIKQAIAEESQRKKFRHSNSNVKNVDDQSISFRLQDDDDDAISRRVMTAASIRRWNDQRIFGSSKISGFQNIYSRKSPSSSQKTDLSITTLKRASPRSSEVPKILEIVTIKSSDRTIEGVASKTSSTKSPFRNFSGAHSPASPCSNSIMSGISGPFGEAKKILRPIFLNSPIECFELRNKGYKTVPIMVNNQIQALIHSVLDVLERVNPSKMLRIVSTARSPYEIQKILIRPDIQSFIDSLIYQPLISSPNSFVVSLASIVNEIDPRVESSIEKELVATTLAVPPAPGLHRLVQEIRDNLFVDPERMVGSKMRMKIETLGCQRQKLLASFSPKENNVFDLDLDNSCSHSNHSTSAISQDSEITSENFISETNFGAGQKDDIRKSEDTNKEKKSRDNSTDLTKNLAKGAIPKVYGRSTESKTSKISLSKKRAAQQPRNSVYSVARKSGLTKNISGNKLLDKKSIKVGARLSRQKINVDQINEAQSNKGSTSMSGLLATDCESTISRSRSLQKRCSKITLKDDAPSPKCQFKPWKASQNPTTYLEPDRIILRRMTNPQRILVGQMCASLKTRKINMEGLVKERMPLAALIAPVFSKEALRILTKGTRQAKSRKREITDEKDDCVTIVSEELTGPVLAKIRQAVAEIETNRRLTSFLESRI